MATRSELLTGLPDNTSGAIYPVNIRNIVNNDVLPEDLTAGDNITIDTDSLPAITISADDQLQADWTQTATGSVDYIKNKPTIPDAQVNSDWNASSGVAEILNKPSIPDAQVNSDWNAVSGVEEILNKPIIPDAQIQADWT